MRILILSQYFWPEEFIINSFALNLRGQGHTVTVLTGLPNYPNGCFYDGYGLRGPYRDEYQGIPICRTPLISRGNSKGLRLILNFFSFALSACLRALFLPRSYDVILVFEVSPITVGIPARLLRRLTRAKLYFWVLDLWPDTLSATGVVRSQKILNGVGKLTSWVYRGCDRILIASEAFRSSVSQYDAAPEKIFYFPNWAEHCFRRITLPDETEEHELMPPGFRIMFAGNVGVSQDFETILAAAEKTAKIDTSINWVIVGDGRHRSWVEKEIHARSLNNIHLLGRHPKEKMPVFFSLADVMLVSLKDEPIFRLTVPAKIQAYFACGKPVLSSLNGEGARIVKEAGAGIAVAAENPEELAEAACRLAKADPRELQAMGSRALEYYEQHFGADLLIARFEQWMNADCREGGS